MTARLQMRAAHAADVLTVPLAAPLLLLTPPPHTQGFLRELAVFQRARRLRLPRHFWLRKVLAGWRRHHSDSMHLKRNGRATRTETVDERRL